MSVHDDGCRIYSGRNCDCSARFPADLATAVDLLRDLQSRRCCLAALDSEGLHHAPDCRLAAFLTQYPA